MVAHIPALRVMFNVRKGKDIKHKDLQNTYP